MPHVSLITLGVDDLARSTTFYRALGWRVSSTSVEGVVAFLLGGAVPLGLFPRDALAAEANVAVAANGMNTACAFAMNLPSPAEVDEMCTRVETAGGTITAPPSVADWGGYSAYVRDPDNHLWEIVHNPGFELDSDGRVALPE
ncbi:MAG: VOC family protein [Nitriliruptoraceae bacterium]